MKTQAKVDASVPNSLLPRNVTSVHNTKQGKVSNKWSSYLTYYDALFDSIKDAPLRLFEIGIQNGGSLETWSQYFVNAESILGCDVDEKCGLLSFEDRRIGVIVGNANSTDTHEEISRRGPYDVIVDDGSHLSEDILISFLNYFPLLKPGGIYVIEDTHAVYQRQLTNIHNKKNVMGFFRDLTDVINYQFWFRDQTIENLLKSYLSVPLPGFLAEGWIESIEFRNSIVTIRKSRVASHAQLGEMNVAGDTADVDPEPLRIKRAMEARQRQPA